MAQSVRPQLTGRVASTAALESHYESTRCETTGTQKKMLSQGAAAKFGSYQYAVMAAVTGLGFVGAPWWMAFIAAVLLFGSVALGNGDGHARGGSVQAAAEPGGALFTLAAVSAGFAVACFAGGNVLAGIMLR
jgi:hypothetical protein